MASTKEFFNIRMLVVVCGIKISTVFHQINRSNSLVRISFRKNNNNDNITGKSYYYGILLNPRSSSGTVVLRNILDSGRTPCRPWSVWCLFRRQERRYTIASQTILDARYSIYEISIIIKKKKKIKIKLKCNIYLPSFRPSRLLNSKTYILLAL